MPTLEQDVWMLILELWGILRYQSPGSHQAKLKAAELLQERIEEIVELRIRAHVELLAQEAEREAKQVDASSDRAWMWNEAAVWLRTKIGE